MVHNGTITHFKDPWPKKYPGKTDSHQLAQLIAAGIPLGEIDGGTWGAWACVWYDSEDETLNFWRNKERPFGFVETDKAIWFSSEPYSMAAALDRRNVELKGIERFPADHLWKWHPDNKWEKIKVIPKNAIAPPVTVASVFNDPCFADDCSSEFSLVGGNIREILSDSGGANGSKPAGGKTAVEVYPDKPTSSPLQIPNYSSRGAVGHNYSKKGKKERWLKINNALGLAEGDILTCSLSDFNKTNRPAQVRINAKLVVFGQKSNPQCQMGVTVCGMMGMGIEEADGINTLLQAVVSEIYMPSGTNPKGEYRFMVRDVKLTELPDPFLQWHPLRIQLEKEKLEKANAAKAVQVETKPEHQRPNLSGGPSTTPVVIPAELKESAVISTKRKLQLDFMKCQDCGAHFDPVQLQRIKRVGEEDSDYDLKLCRKCCEECLKDPGRMARVIRDSEYWAQAPADTELAKNILH